MCWKDHFYIYHYGVAPAQERKSYQVQGPAGFPGLQDIVFQNGHWQFYDTSHEKNVIWRESQLHAGAVYWVPTSVQNCAKFVQNCAKLCSAPLSLHLSRTHGEPQEVQGEHCQ